MYYYISASKLLLLFDYNIDEYIMSAKAAGDHVTIGLYDIGDVEEAGTFGDLLGGPTELTRDEEYDPQRMVAALTHVGEEDGLKSFAFLGEAYTIMRYCVNLRSALGDV